MGTKERKERERFAKKIAIMEITKELIINKGLESFTIQDIARMAEISKGSIYLHFQTKEQILQEIFTDSNHKFVEYVKKGISGDVKGIDILHKFWKLFNEFFIDSNELFILPIIKNSIDPYLDYENEASVAYEMRGLLEELFDKVAESQQFSMIGTSSQISRYLLLLITSVISNFTTLPVEKRNIKVVLEDIGNAAGYFIRGCFRTEEEISFIS